MGPGVAVDAWSADRYHGSPFTENLTMIDEAPSIRHQDVARPAAALVDALRGRIDVERRES
jgi:hypothetical protein